MLASWFWHESLSIWLQSIVMTNQATSLVQPEVLSENKKTIHSFLSDSYSQAKKQIGEGMHLIQDGMSFIKDEFSAIYDKTGQYLNRMALPVNNFLKDLTQIEQELLNEISKDSQQLVSMDGRLVPVEQVLAQPMEENY
jgi:hypothetical protein